jgi:hypothetical protein
MNTMVRALTLSALLLVTTVLQAGVPASPSKAELHEWMLEALAAAEKIPAEERRAKMREIDFGDTRLDEIKEDLYRIALRPQFYNAYNLVLDAQLPRQGGMIVTLEESAADRAAAEEFVVELYRSRMGTASEDARNWQHGLAEFLLTMGRWKEALPLARGVYEQDRDAYTTTMLAVIEKLNGNNEMFEAVMKDCPELDNEHGDHFCTDVALSLANRMTHVLPGDKIPPGIRDILSGKAKPEATWADKLRGLAILQERDAKATDTALRDIIATADLPAWVKDDAMILLMETSSRLGNKGLALNLSDCWLGRRGATAPVVDAATWQRLLAMEKPRKEDEGIRMNVAACRQVGAEARVPLDPAGDCIAGLLQYQALGITNPGDRDASRQAIEWMASIVATTGRGMRTLATLLVLSRAAAETPEERDNVLRYVAQLPVESKQLADETAPAVRTQTQPVTQPWASPTIRRPPVGCP